jgi:hypothetical protein
MINIKKGTAHTLQQSDRRGKIRAGEGVVSGMLVNVNLTEEVVKGLAGNGGADGIHGFALNSQTDGDVIESGTIGVLLLDGNSVVETDQVTGTINAANFPIGAPVSIDGVTGKVKAGVATEMGVGVVEGIRQLPSTSILSQDYKNIAGNTMTNVSRQPVMVTVLGIKLASHLVEL